MSAKTLNIFGNIIYAIGALILILSVAAFALSAGMVLLAGPVVILFPIIGGVLFGTGKGMIDRSKRSLAPAEKVVDNAPEKSELLDDNARKFIVQAIDRELLKQNSALSYTLTVDWLETGAHNEKKVARKKFDNGEVQILLISKLTIGGNRTSERKNITEEEYHRLLSSSILHLDKKRHEFEYTQNNISFSIKYDEFAESELCILEVDALSEEERNSFNPNAFSAELSEVTGDISYYGYRVANII